MYKINPELRWRDEGENIIIFCPKRARLFQLNATAAEIWKILDNLAAETIAEQIAAKYSMPTAEILPDVEACLQDLLQKNLIYVHN